MRIIYVPSPNETFLRHFIIYRTLIMLLAAVLFIKYFQAMVCVGLFLVKSILRHDFTQILVRSLFSCIGPHLWIWDFEHMALMLFNIGPLKASPQILFLSIVQGWASKILSLSLFFYVIYYSKHRGR